MKPPRRRRPYRYFMVGKHRYRTLNPDAGARSYRSGRAWFGGYSQAAVSMFAGAPLAINIFSADQNEHTQWPELLDRTLAATGGSGQRRSSILATRSRASSSTTRAAASAR